MNRIKDINTINEYNSWVNNNPNNFIIIYLYSNSCETCNKLEPLLDNFNCNDKIIFLKINVDESNELIRILDITTYPVFRIYKNNLLINEIFGTYDNIIDILKNIT